MSFFIAGAIVGTGLGSAIIGSRAASSAASSQSAGLQYATDAQIAAADKAAAATLAGYKAAAGATKYAADKSASAIRYGADQAAESAQAAIDAQMAMYNQTREDQMPWLKAGRRSLETLEGMVNAGPGEFTESPGYQFRLDEGNKNILGAASATGGLASGRTLKALQEYGQDYASNEYTNFLNQYYQSLTPYQSLAGVGMNAAQSIGAAGTATGQGVAGTYNALGQNQLQAAGQLANTYTNEGSSLANIYGAAGASQASGYMNTGNILANNYMGQGNISAANTMNQSNAWTGAINQGLSAFGMYAGMNQGYSPGAWETGYAT